MPSSRASVRLTISSVRSLSGKFDGECDFSPSAPHQPLDAAHEDAVEDGPHQRLIRFAIERNELLRCRVPETDD